MPAVDVSSGLHRPDRRRQADAIVVCGAGAAGLAAALAAARAGAPVTLLEATPRPGGTVAAALIHTLAGLYDSAGHWLQEGLGAELVDRLMRRDSAVRRRRMGRLWVLQVCPNLYRSVVETWIAEEAALRLETWQRVVAVACEGNRLTRLETRGRGGLRVLMPQAVVDATGTAEVVRLLDPRLLQEDSRRSAAGLIFRMRGVPPHSLDFPRGAQVVQALRAAASAGTLPASCAQAWIDTGTAEDEAFVKLFVPLPAEHRGTQRHVSIRQARQVEAAVVSFLHTLAPFQEAVVVQRGHLGIRDGGRICGEYCLSGDDVRQMRKFTDAACRGCWPIEYWDPERGVSLEYLPPDDYYEIPMRSLAVRGLANVWAAGKCLSADPWAHASARVVGTCWAMGEAAGKAAAARVLQTRGERR